jgi:hypothetical protein
MKIIPLKGTPTPYFNSAVASSYEIGAILVALLSVF